MKLLSAVVALAAAQYDYYGFGNNDERIVSNDGAAANVPSGNPNFEGNGKGCHGTKHHNSVFTWDSTANTGYFVTGGPIRCQGLEGYCAIEERAQFGQITGINAGCKDYQNADWRGSATHNHIVTGCVSNMAQNGVDALDASTTAHFLAVNGDWTGLHDWYQNQCKRLTMNAGALLTIGTSKCYVCCEAGTYSASDDHCNFLAGANKAPSFTGVPGIMNGNNLFS